MFVKVSKPEQERRYTEVRKQMAEKGYEALIIAGNSETMQRGYIRYLSDWRLWNGTGYMLIPMDHEPMLTLGYGSQYYWATQWEWITDVRPAYNKIDVICDAVDEYKLRGKKIGVVGLRNVMSYGDTTELMTKLADCQLEDATEMLDDIMAIKSDEEVAQMTETYNLLSHALGLVKDALKPGKTEREVMAEAIYYLGQHECYDGIAHIGNHAAPNIRPATNRIITKDDTIKVSLEWAGPSGHWIELSSVFSFKQPGEREKHYYDTMVRAVYEIVDMMKPGAIAGDISRHAWQVFRDEGFNITDRVIWDFHGIGINVIRPPYGLPDSKDVFKDHMVINMHPGPAIDADKWGVYVQENVVVTPNGGRVLGNYKHEWHVLD